MLDDIDLLPMTGDVLLRLRACALELYAADLPFAFLMAASSGLFDAVRSAHEPLVRFFEPLSLGPLDPADARRAVVEPVEETLVRFDPEVLSEIVELEMCHRLPLSSRIAIDTPTISLADLLLSKLQVVRINRKDLIDAAALIAEYPVFDDDLGISIRRIVSVTSSDWGWWRTVTGNLATLRTYVATELPTGESAVGHSWTYAPSMQVDRLLAAIDEAPKSVRWRLRAVAGERLPWYLDPEEVEHG